ncbi:PH domain-containing protein [Lacticaseibacillus sharpeae]|nr:PH domain-containing protein [Lacticaseibacillus sharpeae]
MKNSRLDDAAYDWHRQSPLMLVIFALRYIIRVTIALVLVNLKDIHDLMQNPQHILWLFLLFMVIGLVIVLCVAVPKYFTTKYALTDTAFILRSGVFRRKMLHINYANIQTVQNSQWFFYKPFKVATLTVETAAHAGDEPEVKLDAVPQSLVNELKARQQAAQHLTADTAAHLMQQTATAAAHDDSGAAMADSDATFAALQAALNRQHERPVTKLAQTYAHTLDIKELLAFAFTSLGFISTILLLLSGLSYLDRVPWLEHWLESHVSHLPVYLLVVAVASVFGAGILISLFMTLARYWHFTIHFDGETVTTEKGLFQTNHIAAPARRIQAVRFQQNIIRGLLKKGTAQVILASAVGKADEDNDLVLYPMLPASDVWARLHRVVAWLPSTQPALQQFTTGTFAMIRNAIWFPFLVALALTYFFHWLGAIAFLWPLLCIGFGFFASHARGFAISDKILFMTTGSMFVRSDFAVARNHVQSVDIHQSWWMAKTHLVHVEVHVRKGNGDESITLRYVPEAVGRSVYAWYLGPAALVHRTAAE